jgi:glycosyltransferase involved in cell wall biosynthesis
MRILLISDYSLQHTSGGAQRSNSIIMDEGRQRGHAISEFNYDSNPEILEQNYDVVISSNLESISRINPQIIPWIASRPNHVRLEHDANRYLSKELRTLLFQSCKKTFFLSKFHYQNFVESYENSFVNVEIVPDPIDSKLFKDLGEEREDKILYVGFMHPFKGTDRFFSYVLENPDLEFVVAGWSADEGYIRNCEVFSNIEMLGKIDYEEMASLYNKYAKLFYKPVFYEPFCRSIAEALFCGIEIESNDLVGSLHLFEEVGYDEFVCQCNEAPQTFWEKVECLQ